jgi:hypothetical protein
MGVSREIEYAARRIKNCPYLTPSTLESMDYEKGRFSPTDWSGDEIKRRLGLSLWRQKAIIRLTGIIQSKTCPDAPFVIPHRTTRKGGAPSIEKAHPLFTAVDLQHGECHHNEILLCALRGRERNP